MTLKTMVGYTGGGWLVAAAVATTLSAQQPVEGSAAAGYATVTAGTVALTGATLIDGTGEPARRGQTVVIRNVTVVFKDGVGYDSAKLLGDVRGRVGIS